MKDTLDISHVTLNELSDAYWKTRKTFRENKSTSEISLVAVQRSKAKLDGKSKRQQNGRHGKEKKGDIEDRKYPPCFYCKKTNHTEKFCWYKPGIQCKLCKQFSHVDKVCKINQNQPSQVKSY